MPQRPLLIFSRFAAISGALFGLGLAPLAYAQEAEGGPPQGAADAAGIFGGDYLSVGIGVGVSPSYSGSDDYSVSVLPIVQGSLGGIDIEPRPAGIAFDFVQDGDGPVGVDFGLAARLRSDRAKQIKDEVVESLGELDRAIELGPTIGLRFPKILHPFDAISVSTDVMWDVNGAHKGMVVMPSVSYFSPLSMGAAASLSLNAEYADAGFHDYYFRVTPAQSLATAGELPVFQPDGGGFTSAGATLIVGIDLNGDITDGGLGLAFIGGYNRVLGDAKRTPFTSVRGTNDQFLGVIGIGYTF